MREVLPLGVPLAQGDAHSIDAHMRGLISRHRLEDTFYVMDLGAVQRLHAAWAEALPRVRPFYEVRWVLLGGTGLAQLLV